MRRRTPRHRLSAGPPLFDVPPQLLAHFGLRDDGRTRTISTLGVRWHNRHYVAPWMVGRSGERIVVRHLPHHDTAIEVFGLDGTHLGTAVLSNAASKEQVLAVRNARTAKARQLRADLRAAAKLRRTRFKAATAAAAPVPLGALTQAQAEAEAAGTASGRRKVNPDYIPHQPVPDGWTRPLTTDTAASQPDVLKGNA